MIEKSFLMAIASIREFCFGNSELVHEHLQYGFLFPCKDSISHGGITENCECCDLLFLVKGNCNQIKDARELVGPHDFYRDIDGSTVPSYNNGQVIELCLIKHSIGCNDRDSGQHKG